MLDYDRYLTLGPEHDPARMPHDATAHECEARISWHDTHLVTDALGAVRARVEPTEQFTATLPHCFNETCPCTQHAAEDLVAAIDTPERAERRERIVATHVNARTPENSPCRRRNAELLADFFAHLQAGD